MGRISMRSILPPAVCIHYNPWSDRSSPLLDTRSTHSAPPAPELAPNNALVEYLAALQKTRMNSGMALAELPLPTTTSREAQDVRTERKEPMSAKKTKLKFRSEVTRDRLQEVLGQLANAVEAGVVQVRVDGEEVRLRPGYDVKLELEARTDADEESLSLQIRWTPAPTGSLRIDGSELAVDWDESATPEAVAGTMAETMSDATPTGVTQSAMPLREVLGLAANHWTHQELYAKAQEIEIDGRSGLHKEALIEALLDHGHTPMTWPMEEILGKLRKAEITGRPDMDRHEMIEALAEAQVAAE